MSEKQQSVHKRMCRVCSDFADWLQGDKTVVNENKSIHNSTDTSQFEDQLVFKGNCPPNRGDIGRATWSLMHTAAAYFPDNPTEDTRRAMKDFINSMIHIYPCEECREDFQKEMTKRPVDVTDRDRLSNWLCDQHNIVNRKLLKPEFDCSMVLERWKDGWKDGSCG
ncbi:hypothetical protein GJ496_004370 [Pomphorhynchus laevis]|nr:hypothetical protein GJ496_004370 [Pomphorhynchus laevis]